MSDEWSPTGNYDQAMADIEARTRRERVGVDRRRTAVENAGLAVFAALHELGDAINSAGSHWDPIGAVNLARNGVRLVSPGFGKGDYRPDPDDVRKVRAAP